MKSDEKVKFVSEVDVSQRNLEAKGPFKVNRDNQRQFVRLEISAPVSLAAVKDSLGNFSPEGDRVVHEGAILNISAGGVLVELHEPLGERDIVLMSFILQEVERVNNILGIVKRVEKNDADYLVGIEFISRENLKDLLSESEINLLSDNVNSFHEKVHEVLSRYLYEDATGGKDE